jgi:hypothetical protein
MIIRLAKRLHPSLQASKLRCWRRTVFVYNHECEGGKSPPSHPSGSGAGVQGALGEIDLLLAPRAGVFLVEFIRKNFNLLPALGALALECLKVLELLKTRAMLRCTHGDPPLIKSLTRFYESFAFRETRMKNECE